MQLYTAHSLLAIDEMKDNFKQMLKLGKDMCIAMTNMKEPIKLL